MVVLEVFEIYRHPTIPKVVVLVIKIVVVGYLVFRIRKNAPTRGKNSRLFIAATSYHAFPSNKGQSRIGNAIPPPGR